MTQANRLNSSHPTTAQQTEAGLTEIWLPSAKRERLTMLFPMLAHLSRNSDPGKWFTWIAPEGIEKRHLIQQNFKLDNIQLIHTKHSEESLWALWESLRSGRSSVVVASCQGITKQQYINFNAAAMRGNTLGLLIAYSNDSR